MKKLLLVLCLLGLTVQGSLSAMEEARGEPMPRRSGLRCLTTVILYGCACCFLGCLKTDDLDENDDFCQPDELRQFGAMSVCDKHELLDESLFGVRHRQGTEGNELD